MIELVNVNKSFADKQVLFDINAKFEPGIPNLIIGASGGGKSVSTTMVVILCIYPTKRYVR
jgi:phospholipid/cholesterol/gamma-HCH transport system ATP-binding protein